MVLAATSLTGIAIIAVLAWTACFVQLLRLVSARAKLAKVRQDASVDPETGLIAAHQFHERLVAERRRISRLGGAAHVHIMRFETADHTRSAGRIFREHLLFPACGFRLDNTAIALVTLASGMDTSHDSVPAWISDARFDIDQEIDEAELAEMITSALEQVA